MSISVVICTWNRAELLRKTLSSFKNLEPLPDIAWELIVVDNNSTDNTRQIVDESQDVLPIRYVFEPAQGLSHARNRALREVRHDLILWTDDDVHVQPDWLSEYAKAMVRFPDAVFFGGTIDPYFVAAPPQWLSRNLDVLGGAYGLRQFGSVYRPITELADCPYGANMAMRKGVFAQRAFDVDLGLRGAACRMLGEETAIFDHLLSQGQTGVWVGAACIKHTIPVEHTTRQYLWNYFYWVGRTKERQLIINDNNIDMRKMRRKNRKYMVEKWRLRFRLQRDRAWATRLVRCAKWLGRIDEMRL